MLKITINGQSMEVAPGTTIIEAFKKHNQNIAHYCWHPGLSVAGVCRLCMVHIEGMPRLQIACNTEVKDGMVISNQNEAVQEAVKWGLDFHLINHPLDCPICDQAGECGLQEQYMEYGQYDSEMAERKVKKHKVVDLGPTIVLDTERCILCSRCVRFTEEVTQTYELGIFNRGDRSEIGTFAGKPLANKYSLNTVDICPVGALTSKDFRFRQRVWYLKQSPSVCPGCSTGCAVTLYHNEEGFWRVKPRHNPDVNGYWMCDEGRDVYKYANLEHRLKNAERITATDRETLSAGNAVKNFSGWLSNQDKAQLKVAVVATGQYSCEEYEQFFAWTGKELPQAQVFHWWPFAAQANDFDSILIRGDRDPNTAGLKLAAAPFQLTELNTLEDFSKYDLVIVLAPENTQHYPDVVSQLNRVTQAKNCLWLGAAAVGAIPKAQGDLWLIPTKTFAEKDGSFINYKQLKQKFKRATTIVKGALSLTEFVSVVHGESLLTKVGMSVEDFEPRVKTNHFTAIRGAM